MRNLRNRLKRIDRLRELEQNKLVSLAQKLSHLDAGIANIRQAMQTLQNAFNGSIQSIGDAGAFVSARVQTHHWANGVIQQLSEMTEQESELAAKRDSLLTEVTQQRQVVRSWEKLSEKLALEIQQEIASAESMQIEEQYLRRYAGSAEQ